jgi:glycosyl transferase family 2
VKLVLTVLARDEADVVDAQIAFHLNAGVDFVVATDNRSQDGTTEILESYARDGCLRVIHEPAEGLNQSAWVTRMARLAATEHGADWVINSDADEFWWPRGASLRDLLLAVPKQFGIVRAFWRSFVPRPDDGSFFAERMTARVSSRAPINDPTSFYRPVTKVAHRADPDVIVGRGNHALVGSRLAPLATWHPIEVLHFPLRSRAQWRRKVELQGVAFTEYIERVGAGYHLKSYEALQTGRIDEQYESMVVDDGALARGVAGGTLVVDTRLRDVLRELRRAPEGRSLRSFALPTERRAALVFPEPTIADDTEYAVQAAVLGEADVVRAQRRLDALEQRLRPPRRARRSRS